MLPASIRGSHAAFGAHKDAAPNFSALKSSGCPNVSPKLTNDAPSPHKIERTSPLPMEALARPAAPPRFPPPSRHRANADSDNHENNSSDNTPTSRREKLARMQAKQRKQAANRRRNSQNNGEGKRDPDRFYGQPK